MKHPATESFEYIVFSSKQELNPADAQLLEAAIHATSLSYSPYSRFRVGAAARLSNGTILTGANQENASFPVGLCAERVVLASAASQYPELGINDLAISYKNEIGESKQPISPCGICRQALSEFSEKTNQPIRLILGGIEGEVFIIEDARQLLPLGFTAKELH